MILSVILTIIAAFFKALMDYVQFFDVDGWRNKWKNGIKIQGEKFPFSSTLFVFLTDRWHMAQSLFLTTIFALVVTHQICFNFFVDFIFLRFIFGASFELFYRHFKDL